MGKVREEQKVKINFDVEGSPQEIECQVKEIFFDRISLTKPKEIINFYQYLKEGTEIDVTIFTPAGVQKTKSLIIDCPLEKDFVVEFVESDIKVQRREFSRTHYETKFIIERITGDNIVTNTLDIGGGGIKFFSEQAFEAEQLINARLYLPPQQSSLLLKGKIINTPHLPPTQHVMVFTDIDEFDRDKIIKKCFEIEAANYKPE